MQQNSTWNWIQLYNHINEDLKVKTTAIAIAEKW